MEERWVRRRTHSLMLGSFVFGALFVLFLLDPPLTELPALVQQKTAAVRTTPGPKGFSFHVYTLPPALFDNFVNHSAEVFDWRHDDLQLNVPYYLYKSLPHHPLHTNNPEEADVFIIPHAGPMLDIRANHDDYVMMLRSYLESAYGEYMKRRRGTDHFIFAFTVGSRYGNFLPGSHLMSFELEPYMLPAQRWSAATDCIIMPFVEQTPRLLQRIEDANRAASDDAFLDSEAPRDNFAFFSASYTGPSSALRTEIMDQMDARNDTEVYFLGNRHTSDKYDVLSERMIRSVFCPSPSGDSPSARRQFTAALAGCIPVVFSDFLLKAYEGMLDWSEFSIQLPTRVLAEENFIDILRRVPPSRIRELQRNLLSAARRFVYHAKAPVPGDALDTLVDFLAVHAYKVRKTNDWMHFTNGSDFNNLIMRNGKALNFFPDNL